MSEDPAAGDYGGGEQYKSYDGGVRTGPPVQVSRARVCVISCSSLDTRPSRFALVVKHNPSRHKLRKIRCPVCGKRTEVVFQLIEVA